jgi:hypothetical protein
MDVNHRQEEEVGGVWDGTAVCTRWCAPQRQTLTYGDPAAVVRARRRLGAVPTRQSGRLRKTVMETPYDGNPLTTIV